MPAPVRSGTGIASSSVDSSRPSGEDGILVLQYQSQSVNLNQTGMSAHGDDERTRVRARRRGGNHQGEGTRGR